MYYKSAKILQDFIDKHDTYTELEIKANEIMVNMLKKRNIPYVNVEHRVKDIESLRGKLERKGDKYSTIYDITDLVGLRIICYFADDVDKLAALVEKQFVIDEENSINKGQLLSPNSFGYLSIHYICSLKKEDGYSDELCKLRFEIQIRTILQHAWSSIDHDLAYKTDFGIPKSIVRDFAKIASLLEIADGMFMSARDGASKYCDDLIKKVTFNDFADMEVDVASLLLFFRFNRDVRRYLREIEVKTGISVTGSKMDNHVPELLWLGCKNLKDVQDLLLRNKDMAVRLAEVGFASVETSSVSLDLPLTYLCVAELIKRGYKKAKLVEFFNISKNNKKLSTEMADVLLMFIKKLDDANSILSNGEVYKAYKYALLKHKPEKRKNGEPYITHPLAVAGYLMEKGYDNKYLIAGLFHDLLEDTDATEEEILQLGGEEVLQAVKLVTKTPGYNMQDYMEGIKNNPMALQVKIADRVCNLRTAIATDEKFRRRYIKETEEWFKGWSPDIDKEVRALKRTLVKKKKPTKNNAK